MADITQAQFNQMLQTALAQGLPGGYIQSQYPWEDVEQTLAHLTAQVGALKKYSCTTNDEILNVLKTVYSSAANNSMTYFQISTSNLNTTLYWGDWLVELYKANASYGIALASYVGTARKSPPAIFGCSMWGGTWGEWSLISFPGGAGGAGGHNSVFRGFSLGSSVTDAQYASISSGLFDNMYIGDYWTIGGVDYRIAAFDYFLNTGDTLCTQHHAVIVPDSGLYLARMNPTDTTAGAYVGSEMYNKNLEQAKTTIESAFQGHVLSHRVSLSNAVSNGIVSAGAWFSSKVELLCENMVYGCGIYYPVSNGITVPRNYRVEKSQLPLFAMAPHFIRIQGGNYWLRDVITATQFSSCNWNGNPDFLIASYSLNVRPYFCIC